ncbi:hypothetical protein TPL01_21150 [Sulfuriferula plumbiphila]|uniref:Uncharacterized protein n=1 Tax=Sulfuriferula plumbiphila TaxID=171865 RepID=A0A512L936_9PROT|nr:hypothetical protein SFPGR_18280 [Sulfuriferula plumbiphila]GEP30977.1 hypothetical protein TPL01_21150 [Sulfuriferula plumbiphila]
MPGKQFGIKRFAVEGTEAAHGPDDIFNTERIPGRVAADIDTTRSDQAEKSARHWWLE